MMYQKRQHFCYLTNDIKKLLSNSRTSRECWGKPEKFGNNAKRGKCAKAVSNLYRFATVWLDTMHWQPPHVRMGMKIDLVSSNFQASNYLVYEGLDEVLHIESRKGFMRQQCEIALRSFS
ncbi:unnamed protein product [Lathyrus oleraceus]